MKFFDDRRLPKRLQPGTWMAFDPETDATAYQIFKHCFGIGYKGGQPKFRREQFVPLMNQLNEIRTLPEA